MRTSSLKTTAAVLRATINTGSIHLLDQGHMAGLLDCSVDYIKSVESGRVKLSEQLAQRMFYRTGISPAWLIAGDVSAPPVSALREPFTREVFERTQTTNIYWEHLFEWELAAEFLRFAGRLRAILRSANRRNDWRLTAYRIGRFLGSLPDGREDTEAESVHWMRCIWQIESEIAIVGSSPRDALMARAFKPRTKSKRSSRARKPRA